MIANSDYYANRVQDWTGEKVDKKWTRLREEIESLDFEGVDNIHPQIILAYMAFIEQIEEEK